MPYLALAVVACVLVAVVHFQNKDIRALRAQAKVALETASVAKATARASAVRGDSLLAAARKSQRVADSALANARNAKERYNVALTVAPPECDSVVAAAAAVIAVQDTVIQVLGEGINSALASALSYRMAYDTLLVSHEKLASTVKAVNLPKRSLKDRLSPHLGIGLAAGLDKHGHSRVVAGVTFGWRF